MFIASASTAVKFHEFPSGRILHGYPPTPGVGPVRSISWSNDGNWLVRVPDFGYADVVVNLNEERPKLIHTIDTIQDPLCACFQTKTKRLVAVGTQNGEVLIYDIKTGSVRKRYSRNTSSVLKVAFTAKDTHIVAVRGNGEAHVYCNARSNLSGKFNIPKSRSITSLRANPTESNYVVAGSDEGVVVVWDLQTNQNKFVVHSHGGAVTGVAFSPINSDLVVSTGPDRKFCLYSVAANNCICHVFVESNMTSVEFSPDGKFIVLGSENGKIYVYDIKNLQKVFHSFLGHDNAVEHLSFGKYETGSLSYEDGTDSNTAVDNCANTGSVSVEWLNGQEETKSVRSLINIKRATKHKYAPIVPSKLLQDGVRSDL